MENAIMWATANLKPHYEFTPTSYALDRGLRMTATLMPFKSTNDPKERNNMVFEYGINQTVSFVELERITRSCINTLFSNGTIKAILPHQMGTLSSAEIAKIMTCCIDNTYEQKRLIIDSVCEELYKGVSYIPCRVSTDRVLGNSEAMAYAKKNLMLKWGSVQIDGEWTVIISPFGYPEKTDSDLTFRHGDKVFTMEELGCRVLTVIYEYIIKDSPYGTEYARQNAQMEQLPIGPHQWGIMAVLNCTAKKISEDLIKNPRLDELLLVALNGENRLKDVEAKYEEFMNKSLYNSTHPVDVRWYAYKYLKPSWVGRVTNGGNRWNPTQLYLGFDPFDKFDRPNHYGHAYELDGTLCTDSDMCIYVSAAFLRTVMGSPMFMDAFYRVTKRYEYQFCNDETAHMIANELTIASQGLVNDRAFADALYKNIKVVSQEEFGQVINEFMNKFLQF